MVSFSAFTEPFWMALDAGWFRIPRNWNKRRRRRTETVWEKDWVSIFGVQWAKISLVTGKKAHKTCSVLIVLSDSDTCSHGRHRHCKQLNSSIGIPLPKANKHFGYTSHAHISLKQSSNHLTSLYHINSNSYSARKRLIMDWRGFCCTHTIMELLAQLTSYTGGKKGPMNSETRATAANISCHHCSASILPAWIPKCNSAFQKVEKQWWGLKVFVSTTCCQCRAARAEEAPPLGLDTCLDTTRKKLNWGACWAESIFYHYSDKLRTFLHGGSTGQASSSTVYNNDSSRSSWRSPVTWSRAMQQQHGCRGTGKNLAQLRNVGPTTCAQLAQSCSQTCPWLWCPPSMWDCHRVATGRFGNWCAPFHLPKWLPRKTAA